MISETKTSNAEEKAAAQTEASTSRTAAKDNSISDLSANAGQEVAMDQKAQSALMSSLERKESGANEARPLAAVSASAVKELEEMLLLPRPQIEAALRKADGDIVAAAEALFEESF